jgi:hypothetical protein
MKWHGLLAVATGATLSIGSLAVTGAASAQATPATNAASPWGQVMLIPGQAALGGEVFPVHISCGSVGDCAATGLYNAKGGGPEGEVELAWVASERNGQWSDAIAVPGLDELQKGDEIPNITVSCGSAGECSVGGDYQDDNRQFQAFVASESNGSWGNAIEVPGTATLNADGDARLVAMSCSPGSNCVAGGEYTDGSDTEQGFVVSERHGRWGQAIPVPGLAQLNVGGAGIDTMSCSSAGKCSAGGSYAPNPDRRHVTPDLEGFVVTERNGKWGTAIPIPGLSALNKGGQADVTSLSCASPGNCGAGGDYGRRDSGTRQAYVVSEKNGTWGSAIPVPALKALNKGGDAGTESVACATRRTCTAAGTYQAGVKANGEPEYQAFVVTETNGTWGNATQIPNLAALNKGDNIPDVVVSCGAAGQCAAAGTYADGSVFEYEHPFVTSETRGVWGNATQLLGFKALNGRFDSFLGGLSCPAPNHCAAAGEFEVRTGGDQGFVASQG